MTKQENRENIIRALENCNSHEKCRDCPWEECERPDCKHSDYPDGLIAHVIALLKVQEPRLLTADDFENNPDVDQDGFLPAWIEYRRGGDWDEYWGNELDEWGVCRKDRLDYDSMRYWTSRPTDEQREAEPWDR